jgi:hypothetical protein
MRKEVIWAIIAGIVLGLIVTFGVYRINSTITGNKSREAKTATPTPKPATTGEFKIVLDKPSDNDVVTEDVVTVSGLTKASSWITVSAEDGDYIIQSDGSGVFSQDVDLIPGINQIKITAFESAGAKSATEVLVVYSSSFQVRTLSTDSPATGSSSSEASKTSDIRAKVAQNVSNTLNRPKAYIGTVTDITDSTVEIKTAASEIEQISANIESTNVVNTTGTTSKTVKTTDIAIGDFIVAMGYVDGNSVLTAQRILITNPVTEAKITVNKAKVASITKKALSVKTIPDGTDDSVQPNTKTSIEAFSDGKTASSKFASIEAEEIIIYVKTTDNKGASTVRSIFLLTNPQG